MQPEHLRFGGGPSSTVLNPLIAILVLLAVVLIFVLRRKFVIAPFLAGSILVPMDQVVVVGGFHFQMIRVLILVAWIRMFILKNEFNLSIFSGKLNAVDKTVIAWTIVTAIDVSMLWKDSSAVTNELGTIFTVFGTYFLLRFLIRNEEDVTITLVSFVYIAVVVAIAMAIEQATGKNLFAMLGGFRAATTGSLMERDDRFRAMACFGHPILAGTFGATLFPLCLALWQKGRKYHKIAIIGVIAATVITLAANSSTPLLAYCAVILGMFLWPIRDKMRMVRWGIAISLVTLHLIMKAPVWALIARVDVISGSSSYHRYMIVDGCIRHFTDWWLFGTTHNAEWGWDMWDLANQYVAIAESSGLLPLILFIATIVYSFKRLGGARRIKTLRRRDQWFLWTLGVAMLANMVAFFGIAYWDQTQVLWYAFLAIIIASTARQPGRIPCRSTDAELKIKQSCLGQNAVVAAV